MITQVEPKSKNHVYNLFIKNTIENFIPIIYHQNITDHYPIKGIQHSPCKLINNSFESSARREYTIL